MAAPYGFHMIYTVYMQYLMWSIALLDFFLTTTMVNFRLNYFVHSASAYKIWRLSLQSFRRFDYEHRKWKRVMWPWLCLFRGWFVILRL